MAAGNIVMKRATRFTFALSILLFWLFLFGITDFGQAVLRGRIPPNATHWTLDDIYMAASFAPFVYALVPSVLLALVGLAFLVAQRLRSR